MVFLAVQAYTIDWVFAKERRGIPWECPLPEKPAANGTGTPKGCPYVLSQTHEGCLRSSRRM